MIAEALGDRAVRFPIESGVDRAALLAALRAIDGAIDAVVTETHAMVRFDGPPPPLDLAALRALPPAAGARRAHAIDVVYDGIDLDAISAITGLAREDVIARHAGVELEVSFVGFLPGWGYLRGLDPVLARVPRRDAPRARVEAGSVAIAGGMSGIYPAASPGGWHVVGRAPGWRALDGDRVRLAVGDRVRFTRIG